MYFFGDLPKLKKFYGTLTFISTQNHICMVMEISKCYSLYSFHQIPVNHHEDIAYRGGIQAVTFLGNQSSLKKILALNLNFNVGVNRKVLKC